MAAKRRAAPKKAQGPRSITDFLIFSAYVGGAILALEYSGSLDWGRKTLNSVTNKVTPATTTPAV